MDVSGPLQPAPTTVAISFTMCSLASALQNLPVECIDWTAGSKPWSFWKDHAGQRKEMQRSHCLR